MEESMKDYERELEASFRKISEGDLISGTVIDVNDFRSEVLRTGDH